MNEEIKRMSEDCGVLSAHYPFNDYLELGGNEKSFLSCFDTPEDERFCR
jgi:hypothetical protein